MLTALEAHEQATVGDHVIGWKVDPDQRRALLKRLPPKYSRARTQGEESNDAIAGPGWQPVDRPIPVQLEPAVFP